MKFKLLTIRANWADEVDFVSQHVIDASDKETIDKIVSIAGDSYLYYGSNQEGAIEDLELDYQDISEEDKTIFDKYNTNSHDFLDDIYSHKEMIIGKEGSIPIDGNSEDFLDDNDYFPGENYAWNDHEGYEGLLEDITNKGMDISECYVYFFEEDGGYVAIKKGAVK